MGCFLKAAQLVLVWSYHLNAVQKMSFNTTPAYPSSPRKTAPFPISWSPDSNHRQKELPFLYWIHPALRSRHPVFDFLLHALLIFVSKHAIKFTEYPLLRWLFFPIPPRPLKSTVIHQQLLMRVMKILPRVNVTIKQEGYSL